MDSSRLLRRSEIEVRAVFLGQRINLKALEKTRRVAAHPFVMEAGSDGYAVLFRYGVVVLFGLNPVEEAAFIDDLGNYIIEPFEKTSTEDCALVIDKQGNEGTEANKIHLNDLEMDKIQLIADILAKSAVLSHYEDLMAQTFDAIEPIATELQSGGPSNRRARDLLKHIGVTMSIQRKMVGHVEIEEKPDVLWERTDLNRLFAKIEDEFEIIERHNALKHKLDLVYKTAETLLGLLQQRSGLRVEWYIVILIIFDIMLHLAEKYLGI